jgi:hypothetical protein
MKNISIKTIIFAFIAFFALVLSACDDILLDRAHSGGKSPAGGIPEGFGAITVNLSQGTGENPIDREVLENLYIEYKFSRDGEELNNITPFEDGKYVLEPGAYTLTVNAYTDSEKGTLLAEGEAEFTIAAGEEAEPVNLTLYPPAEGGGSGSLDFSLEYPSGGAVDTLTLTRIAGDEDEIDLTEDITPFTDGDTTTFAGTKEDIPVGYYLLRVVVKNAVGSVTGSVKVVHIYRGITFKADYTFSEEDFRFYLVTNAADTGPGSLRDAITNAGAGQAIRIALEPGSMIELESSLEIRKSLSIEGNGVTLTPAASWTTASDTSQLLRITETEAVKISGVHFRDGRATDYGAAIYNSGELTLESCIFSGNRATSGSGDGGGAIYSENTLAARGCTFYGNSAESSGGAVYFFAYGKTLTLAGNLFYGNTADTFPVVRVAIGAVAASYNVVDIAFGTENTACGWTQETGGAYSADMSVLPGTFKLPYGTPAAGKLPGILPVGYPAKDFYGQDISGGGQAGAVQTVTAQGKYLLGLTVNNAARGSVSVSPQPDGDGLFTANSSITLTATPAAANGDVYDLAYWQKGNERITNNPYTFTIASHIDIQAVFAPVLTVDKFTDSTGGTAAAGTLRYAITNAEEGNVIRFTGVMAGETTIELESALPELTNSVSIKGNGVVLTRAASWTSTSAASQLLRITSGTAVVKISGVHFRDGRATDDGAAVYNGGELTLESCIFSGNQTTASNASGGAIYSVNTLTVRGCTFYGNISRNYGGAVYFSASGKTLTLAGNLFYGNTAGLFPVVYVSNSNSTVASSYNVVDVDFGANSTSCGWGQRTGDLYSATPVVLPGTFKILYGGQAVARLPATLPDSYPVKDFYGQEISGGGVAGAVQTVTAQGKYLLGLTVNNAARGSVSVSPQPDDDGLFTANSSITLTATPAAGSGYEYDLAYWQKDDERIKGNPYTFTMDAHIEIQAVFNGVLTVDTFTDSTGGAAAAGTLRHALTNVEEGDVIRFSGVTAGETTIALAGALPAISNSVSIEGNGVVLTRAASWTSTNDVSQLLRIISGTAVVKISRVHFKNGRAYNFGAAIRTGGELILESCIFSGNQTTSQYASGGAIDSQNTVTARGCTFYGNSAGRDSGVVQFYANGKTLTLEGNMFYGNTAASYPVVWVYSNSPYMEYGTVAASYNVVDVEFGKDSTACGWIAGTGDTTFTALSLTGNPFNTTTFVPVSSLGNVLPSSKPANFPETDFYGATRTFPGAPGAVKQQ